MYHQARIASNQNVLAVASNGVGLHSTLQELRSKIDLLEDQVSRSCGRTITLNDVRSAIRARDNRQRFFKGDLFADPAWDILLELYACELAQQRVSASKLCHAAGVPQTTVLRWIAILEREGLVSRQSDALDARRVWINLTSKAVDALRAYFESLS